MTTKLKRQLSVSITAEESNLLDKLNSKGISVVAVFRRGLQVYAEDSIDGLSQNNNA